MLEITSPDFGPNGEICKENTGFGDDISPTLVLSGLSNDAKSLAIIMDDLDVPFVKAFNHWVIWNIPPKSVIEKNIPYGPECPDGSKQGIGYGKNRYRGPKQPPFIHKAHRYQFTVCALDTLLDIPTFSKEEDLIKAMNNHIIQKASLIGWYKI